MRQGQCTSPLYIIIMSMKLTIHRYMCIKLDKNFLLTISLTRIKWQMRRKIQHCEGQSMKTFKVSL